MRRTVKAIFVNGVFRPLEPVPFQDQERVVLTVENAKAAKESLLDHGFHRYCESQSDDSVLLEDVRQALAKIPSSLSNDIRAERDRG